MFTFAIEDILYLHFIKTKSESIKLIQITTILSIYLHKKIKSVYLLK